MSDSASYTSSYLFTSPMVFNEDAYLRLMSSYCGGTWALIHFIFEALLKYPKGPFGLRNSNSSSEL